MSERDLDQEADLERDGRIAETPEEILADFLEARPRPPGPTRSSSVRFLRWLGRLDHAAYRRIARLSTPALDVPLRTLSRAANFSVLWMGLGALLAAVGGRRGRRAAATGLAGIALASFLVNQPMKRASDRRRPDRQRAGVPSRRWVEMPSSGSFPSGHSASAAAFAVGVGDVIPALRLPLGAAGASVAFSRTYTGVHYPGDVAVGIAAGVVAGRMAASAGARLARRRSRAQLRRTTTAP